MGVFGVHHNFNVLKINIETNLKVVFPEWRLYELKLMESNRSVLYYLLINGCFLVLAEDTCFKFRSCELLDIAILVTLRKLCKYPTLK